MAGGTSGYDAFISYSHALDGALARALQTGLERFAKPWYRSRALRVFRDTTSLSANPDLWSSIEKALASSAWLVLMASPDAARSPWIDREVAWWLENKSPQRLLMVLTEGEFAWADDTGHGDGSTAALPPALRGASTEEPRWVDLRWLHDVEQVDQSNPRLRECVADVAATVREVPKDVLVGEHIRQHRRTMRLALGAVTALVVLLIAVAGAGIVAWGQRNQALEQARIATARQLLVQAEAARSTNDPRTALLLGIAADRIHPDGQTHSSLVTSLTGTRYAGTLTGHTTAVGFAFAPSGHTMATGGDGKVILWDITGPAQSRPLGQPLTSDVELVGLREFSPDGRTLATVRSNGTVVLWDVTDLTRPRPLGQPLISVSNHVGWLAFSPDGRTLGIGSSNPGTVILWDITDPDHGRQLGQPLRHGDYLQLAAFFPDGRTLVTASSEPPCAAPLPPAPRPPVRPASPASPAPDVQPPAPPASAALPAPPAPGVRQSAPPARACRIDDFDHMVILWDLTNPDQPRPLGQPLGYDNSLVAFSPQTRLLATESPKTGVESDNTVILWDLTDPSQPRRLDRTLPGVTGLNFSPDGRTLATVHGDTVRLWDLTDPTRPRSFEEPTEPPRIRVWLPGTKSPYLTHNGNTVHSVAFFPDRRRVATVSGEDRTVILWDVTDQAEPRQIGQPITGISGRAGTVAFFPDGRTMATGRGRFDGTLDLWDLTDTATPLPLGRPLTSSSSPVGSVAFWPDGRTLATGSSNGAVILWDVTDPTKPRSAGQPLPGTTDSDEEVAFSPQRRLLATSTADGTVILSDLTNPAQPRRLGPPLNSDSRAGPVTSIAFSPQGRLLATGSFFGHVVLWDVSDPAQARRLWQTSEPIDFMAFVVFSHDGRTMAAGPGEVMLLDLSDPTKPRPLDQHPTGDIGSPLAFSPSGRVLASGSSDRKVILWDLGDPARPHPLGLPLSGHNADVVSMAFSADGRTLVTGDSGGTVILWDVTDPANPHGLGQALSGHNRLVTSVAFSLDGRVLTTGDADGTVILWNLTGLTDLRDHATERACAKTGRGLDRDEWARYIPGLAYQNTCLG